ncbi:MAG: hypothetical protein FJ271_04355 [Planctomycetes bacterium]|nr:hypothetical protein [Planctomycetota bacterium]
MARHEATYHVTVEVSSAALLGRTPGLVRVEGRVVELFRTDGRLRVGDPVTFVEAVTRPGDEIPCGGTRWKGCDEVLAAGFIEAFLDGEPPDCAVALWQSEVVPSPTAVPRMQGRFPLVALREQKRRALAERGRWGSWWWPFG